MIAIIARTAMACLFLLSVRSIASAGPPFATDDPEPVEYRHWEVYLSSIYNHGARETTATAPHVEVNYGIFPDVQFHILAPLEVAKFEGRAAHYGYGDTELGVKYRFYNDEEAGFMAGIFPLLEVPTGRESVGLVGFGSGQVMTFLPVWFQKSWGPWTTYGGGGLWINPGKGNQNFGYVGWLLQRDLSKQLTLGGEVYHQTPSEIGGPASTGFNLGGIINLSDLHHLLFSAGRDFSGPNLASFYLGWQFTFGPGNAKSESP
jgi:hypothetical protein